MHGKWDWLQTFSYRNFINFDSGSFSYCIVHSLYYKFNQLNYRVIFIRLRGLGMLSCRSPPFLFSNKFFETKRRTKHGQKILLVCKNGKKVEVSEEIYKVYWQEKNHENYLKE